MQGEKRQRQPLDAHELEAGEVGQRRAIERVQAGADGGGRRAAGQLAGQQVEGERGQADGRDQRDVDDYDGVVEGREERPGQQRLGEQRLVVQQASRVGVEGVGVEQAPREQVVRSPPQGPEPLRRVAVVDEPLPRVQAQGREAQVGRADVEDQPERGMPEAPDDGRGPGGRPAHARAV
jgi:hypothetical protein